MTSRTIRSWTFRDQFGSVHEKERPKGRGKEGSGKGWSSRPRHFGYMAEVSTTSGGSSYEEAAAGSVAGSLNEETQQDHEDWTEDPEWAEDADFYHEASEELQIEEDVVCWFVSQGVHPQTCSPEDLDMIYDAVEAETTAFFVRDNAQRRGFTAPASSNMYQSQGSLSPDIPRGETG